MKNEICMGFGVGKLLAYIGKEWYRFKHNKYYTCKFCIKFYL